MAAANRLLTKSVGSRRTTATALDRHMKLLAHCTGKHESSTITRMWNQEDLATQHADIAACTLGWHPTTFNSECQLNYDRLFQEESSVKVLMTY